MAGQIYCDCGALLVEAVTEAGVLPPGADAVIPFRRTTDYVVCATCMLAYDVRSLMLRTQSARVIDSLQLLADRQVANGSDEPDTG